MNRYVALLLSTLIFCLQWRSADCGQELECSGPRVLFCDDFEAGFDARWTHSGTCTWIATDGEAGSSAAGSNVGCGISVIDSSWINYVFEYDIKGNAGVDKSSGFRGTESGGYVFAIRSDWITGDEAYLHTPTQEYAQIVTFPSQNGVWYHVQIFCIGNRIRVFVDGAQIIDFTDIQNSCPFGGIGLSTWTGSAGVCDISVDNVKVSMLPSTRGDADGDGQITISDAVFLITYIFAQGAAPSPLSEGETNCDGRINITDVVYLINYIFAGGPAPCE